MDDEKLFVIRWLEKVLLFKDGNVFARGREHDKLVREGVNALKFFYVYLI